MLANVQNTGGRALDMRGKLELEDGPGGLSAGPFPASLGTTLAPGDTGTVTVMLNAQVPAGRGMRGSTCRVDCSSVRNGRRSRSPDGGGHRRHPAGAVPHGGIASALLVFARAPAYGPEQATGALANTSRASAMPTMTTHSGTPCCVETVTAPFVGNVIVARSVRSRSPLLRSICASHGPAGTCPSSVMVTVPVSPGPGWYRG